MRKLEAIQFCRSCSLCYNQPPLLDNLKKAQVFWVGLSAVKVSDVDNEIPLSSNTNTGKLISYIEERNGKFSFYKTNLVKCLPLRNNRIRYPRVNEMESCFVNLQLEIKRAEPKIIFLLGKMVSDFMMRFQNIFASTLDEKFNYETHRVKDVYYVPIHHPSYILIYRRKFMEDYISKVSKTLTNLSYTFN